MSGKLAFAVAAVCLSSGAAWGFDSYGSVTAEHGQITAEALKALDWAGTAISNMQKEVRGVDWEQTSFDKKRFGLFPNDKYMAASHFDRGKNGDNWVTNSDVFTSGRMLVLNDLDAARTATEDGDKNTAFTDLGAALHAVEDLNSHSNLIDMNAAFQTSVLTALFDKSKAFPNGLIFTSYTTDEGETPKNDPLNYTHAAHSKDNAKKNADAKATQDGQTKTNYQLAYDSAVTFVKSAISYYENGLTDDQKKTVEQAALLPQEPFKDMYLFAAAGISRREAPWR